MEPSRDDFIIAIRSAFLKKGTKQRFSLLGLLFFSILLIVLGKFNLRGGMNVVPEFLALTFALSVYTATYIAEAIRSGIEAVDKGQKEAAAAIGLTPTQSLKLIILPQQPLLHFPFFH